MSGKCQLKGGDRMAADCGCGGTCPLCRSVAIYLVPGHIQEIETATKLLGVGGRPKTEKKEEVKK